MALVLTKDTPTITAAEWQARVDLAAAHRVAVWHGFHEGIFNHLTLSVPGKNDRYYQIPIRIALVRGDRELLHGSRLGRNGAGG
jgi:hypothetical protein